jgi:putative membrane protein
MEPGSRLLPMDPMNRHLMAGFLAIWALSCINLPYMDYFGMQHAPTVPAVALLIYAERKQLVDRLGFALIVLFLLLHVLGGRYLYSYVPYDDWSQQLLGFRITERFGWARNHYDRLVHFCFGLLLAYPLWRLFEQRVAPSGWWPGVLAVCVVLAASAIYEIGEWATAFLLAPDWAEAYCGQQGDAWDAQKDMFLAGAGSTLVVVTIGLLSSRCGKP